MTICNVPFYGEPIFQIYTTLVSQHYVVRIQICEINFLVFYMPIF